MDFSAQLQRSVYKLDSRDTQQIGWRELEAHAQELNRKTAPLFFKGLRRHCASVQRPSARALLGRAYQAAAERAPRLCARRLVLQIILDGIIGLCSDHESTVRASCADALATVVHQVVPLVGSAATNQLNQTLNLGASSKSPAPSFNSSVSGTREALNTPQAFVRLVFQRLNTLLQAPEPYGKQGAAACFLAVFNSPSQDEDNQAASFRGNGGGVELLEQSIPYLQKKLNQALWGERGAGGASLCAIWSGILRKFTRLCQSWPVRARLIECLLHVLNAPADDTHWQFRAAALETLQLCCEHGLDAQVVDSNITDAHRAGVKAAINKHAHHQVLAVRQAARDANKALHDLLSGRLRAKRRQEVSKEASSPALSDSGWWEWADNPQAAPEASDGDDASFQSDGEARPRMVSNDREADASMVATRRHRDVASAHSGMTPTPRRTRDPATGHLVHGGASTGLNTAELKHEPTTRELQNNNMLDVHDAPALHQPQAKPVNNVVPRNRGELQNSKEDEVSASLEKPPHVSLRTDQYPDHQRSASSADTDNVPVRRGSPSNSFQHALLQAQQAGRPAATPSFQAAALGPAFYSEEERTRILLQFTRALILCGEVLSFDGGGGLLPELANADPPSVSSLAHLTQLMRHTGPVLDALGAPQRVAVLRCCGFLLSRLSWRKQIAAENRPLGGWDDVFGVGKQSARAERISWQDASTAFQWIEQALVLRISFGPRLLQQISAQLYRLSGEPVPCASSAAALLLRIRAAGRLETDTRS